MLDQPQTPPQFSPELLVQGGVIVVSGSFTNQVEDREPELVLHFNQWKHTQQSSLKYDQGDPRNRQFDTP